MDSCNHTLSWFEVPFLRPDYAALRPVARVLQLPSRNNECWELFAFIPVRPADSPLSQLWREGN